MIISCPSCGARYKVRDDLIPEAGKRVKCKKCSSLFRAFPGKKAILEKAKQTLPKQASSQATVMVDQSKLSNYLQQQEQPIQESAPQGAPPKKEAQGPSHATVQIDRTKIDAFLQSKVNRAGGDYEPNTTLEVSREELDIFLQKSPQGQAEGEQDGKPAPASESDPSPGSKVNADKFQDLQRALGATSIDEELHKATVEMPPPAVLINSAKPKNLYETPSSPPKISTENPVNPLGVSGKKELDLTVPANFEPPKPSEPDFGDDSGDDAFWTSPSKAPEFPSDEELGLTAEPETDLMGQGMPSDVSFDDVSQGESDDFLTGEDDTDQTGDFLADSPDEADMDFSPQPVEPQPEPAEEMSQSHVASSQSASEPTTLYTVKVEDTEYPNKSLDALDRWIHEGRLLETDLVALVGSSDFKKAYDIPEIRAIFDRYFGQSTSVDANDKPAKKGFFGKLFSIFGKKS